MFWLPVGVFEGVQVHVCECLVNFEVFVDGYMCAEWVKGVDGYY